MSSSGTLTTRRTAVKRKSEPSKATGSDGPKLKSRKTLDAFFTPLTTVNLCDSASDGARSRVHLNIEQTAVLKMVVEEGKSVFFTGSAGTGKSLLLRAIISNLKKKYAKQPDVVSVTASTGMAASNIGGMTIHAWGAVAPGMQSVDTLVSYIRKCKPALQRWKKTKVLIIDEVSMVDGHLFQRLAEIAAKLRRSDGPFGGIQLVVTGDFFQLPPVTKNGDPLFAFESEAWRTCIGVENTIILEKVFRQKDPKFVEMLNQLREGVITPETIEMFKGLSRPLKPRVANLQRLIDESISSSVSTTSYSSTSHNPSSSSSLFSRPTPPSPAPKAAAGPLTPRAANLMRLINESLMNESPPPPSPSPSSSLSSSSSRRVSSSSPPSSTCTPSSSSSVSSLAPCIAVEKQQKPCSLAATIDPTDLFPLRSEVEKANASRLQRLPFPSHFFTSKDSGTLPPDKLSNLLMSMIVPGKLELKEGAQVMLVKNVESEIGLVNGCVGRVAGFARVCDVIGAVAGDDDGKAIIRGVVIGDDGKPVLRGIKDEDKENKKEDIHASPVKSEGSKSKPSSSAAKGKKKARPVDETLYPVVTFPITPLPPPPPPTSSSSSTSMVPPPPPGPTTETLLLLPDEFRIEDNEGTLLCRRLQIPLVLAWAMSIHKSQGQTIAKVRVDLGRCFEKGQCYVAVSRAVGVEGLQVVGFDPKKVGPHEKVVKWYKELKEERGRMKSGGESMEAELIDADVETAAQ